MKRGGGGGGAGPWFRNAFCDIENLATLLCCKLQALL